jgi:hypothetical protein
MPTPKVNLRKEFRMSESQRVRDSVSLAEKFPKLQSMSVELAYFNPGNPNPSSQLKYTANVTNAKSVFRVDCNNHECVQGDFDLSAVLAEAITKKQKALVGEATCQGWRRTDAINQTRCHTLLRYKFTLGY